MVLFLQNYGRMFSSQSQAAAEPSTSDGLTVEDIVANNWTILDEDESDWKSHASTIAQSIHLYQETPQAQLDKADLWDDPVCAGQISCEHGLLMGKMTEIKAFEQVLLEHIGMIKLSCEGNDAELELVQAGAGGTASMDWDSMVMQMYKKWAQHWGYGVTIVDEMPGEIAGIKPETIRVDGEYVFGYAKAEDGAHCLVLLSPFDSANCRHTSFAAVAVIPILGEGFSCVQIKESDLRIERIHSGGSWWSER